MPFLAYRDGDDAQQRLELRDGHRLTIGRLPSHDLTVDWDASVSRTHAMLEQVATDWTVVDDGLSSNGTFVNDRRVAGRRRLTDGDVVRIGETDLQFCAPAAESIETVPAVVADPVALSPAQRRVLVALCRPVVVHGAVVPATNREIADELSLSVDTVRTQVRALFGCFAVGDLPQNRKRSELAHLAVATRTVRLHDYD